ncbi:MAG TPA: prolyl oligopeptidase family serine peptidase, partial [Actinomycetota bacterium]|nr:prolyl oligopeptidase family serine peptidase [Actinomycetota bacterium]
VAEYGDVDDNSVRVNTDIEEIRVAADDDNLYVLVRTAGMIDDAATGVLVLFGDDLAPHDNAVAGGLVSKSRKWLLAAGSTVHRASNIDPSHVSVATNSSGYTNAVEIAIPFGAGPRLGWTTLAVAVCAVEGDDCKNVKEGSAASNYLNVGFRYDEPQRIWMDHDQAFALHDGNIDRFMTTVNLGRLASGYTETFEPRSGYWERVYVSDSPVNNEAQNSGTYFQGQFQHYGVYLPSNFRSTSQYPATWWAHYRGGHAHDAAAWVPGLLRNFGEQKGNIVITPSARGTSTWYVGRGMEDFLEVWDDAMATFPIDADRVYMTGYSMGGFGSYLLPTLMPDRFAGASPQEGPITQGLFIAPGMVQSPQNGGDVEAENTYNVFENLRNVAYAIYAGTTDELVWFTGQQAAHLKLTQLGYNNRLYAIHGGEHYASAILDQWQEAANYLNEFRRDPNPPRVTYRTWPAIERAVSTISTLPGQNLGYRFNSAYWVSGLEARTVRLLSNGKPDPRDWGTIDAVTYGRGLDTYTGVPEAGAGTQGLPYHMTGWRNVKTGREGARNALTATLTNIANATLDLARMGISNTKRIDVKITTDGPATVVLRGTWPYQPPAVEFDPPAAGPATYSLTAEGLAITFSGAGSHNIVLLP